MAKQKSQKRKPGIVRRIFKWIGLTLLAVLIIFMLIFQVPWKATTLLIVIFLACTVVPKPARKWFWFSVAAVVLVLIIWVFLPEDNEGWRPYTFDEELAVLQAKYAIPDSENAAIIYNELLESYDANDFEPNFTDPNIFRLTGSQPWSGTDNPEVADWLKGHEHTMVRLMEACRKEKCRYPIIADTFDLAEQMDRFVPMRNWARLIVRAANNDLGDGRNNAAMEKYMAVLRMAEHKYQQSAMIDIMEGIAIEILAIRQFKRFVVTGDPTEEHISIIEKAVADIKHNWSSDFSRVLECEKLMAKNMWAFFYEVNPEGRTRFSRSQSAPCTNDRQCQLEDVPPQSFWRRKLRKASAIWAWLIVPATPKKVAAIIDTAFEPLYEMAEPNFDWQQGPPEQPKWPKFNFSIIGKLLADLLEGSYYGIHDLYLRTDAEKKGTLLIIALRRYKNENGQWPEKLDDVKSQTPEQIFTDPINGNSFVYKLTEEDFTLYSKGKNNIDEDGEGKRCGSKETDADDWLIWPRMSQSCKIEEEKTDAE